MNKSAQRLAVVERLEDSEEFNDEPGSPISHRDSFMRKDASSEIGSIP